MRKGKQKPGTPTKNHPVNIDRITVPSGNPGELPPDLPMKMVVDRVFGQYIDSELDPEVTINGLLGHVVGLDFYTKGHGSGHYIEVNVYRDPNALKIEVNGEEVWRWVEDASELPLRTSEVIDEMRRVHGEWSEQVDLQPGDEVLEGNVIIRADDDEDLPLDDDDDLIFDDEEDEDAIIWD